MASIEVVIAGGQRDVPVGLVAGDSATVVRDEGYGALVRLPICNSPIPDSGNLQKRSCFIQRDRSVFDGCAEYGIPLVWNLAGGYKRDENGSIAPVLALHSNTMIECIKALNVGREEGKK